MRHPRLLFLLLLAAGSAFSRGAFAQTPSDELSSDSTSDDSTSGDSMSDAPATPEDPGVSLAASIQGAFAELGGFDSVTVSAPPGLVVLRGEVGTNATRGAAEDIARVFASGRYIANSIEIAPAHREGDAEGDPAAAEQSAADEVDHVIEERLRRIFATVSELSEVRVESSGGIVVLTGTAHASTALERAVSLAEEQEGVAYVDSDVSVVTTLGEQLGSTWSRLEDKLFTFAGRLPMYGIALLVLFLGVLLARGVRRSKLLGRLLSSHAVLQAVLLRIIATALVIVSALIALDLLDATAIVGALLGTAGVAGIAVAFAFKDIIENYLAGILLAVSRPFAPGDAVKIAGHEGKVVGLAARETLLMTYDGNHVQIPNAQVFGEAVVNYTRNPRRRFEFTLGIGNDESLARVQELVLQVLRDMSGVMNDPSPLVLVEAFGDSSMTVRVFGWVDQKKNDFANVRGEAVRQTKRVLDQAGVNMPNPIYQIITMNDEAVERVSEQQEATLDLGVNTELDAQIAEEPPVASLAKS